MKLDKIFLFFIMMFSGFNFLSFFKIKGASYFQIVIIIYIILSIFFIKQYKSPKFKPYIIYKFYIISSIPAFIIGIILNDSIINEGFLVFLYTLFPFLLFRFSFFRLNASLFKRLLLTLCFSMFLIVIIGWMLRMSIIPTNTFFDVKESEYLLGYWGISYLESTRNHDYFYPLVGLCISIYFYTIGYFSRASILLISLFSITLIASNSRAAIIIVVFSIFLLLKNSSYKYSFVFLLIMISIVLLNYKYIKSEFSSKYQPIISSIYESNNSNSNFSNSNRLIIIDDALQSSMGNPFGYGFANYSYIYDKNFSGHISSSGENAYLTVLVERGLVSFCFFIFLFFYFFKENFNSKKNSLNTFLVPTLSIYFLFNYELNSIFPAFIFYIILIDNYLNHKTKKTLKYE